MISIQQFRGAVMDGQIETISILNITLKRFWGEKSRFVKFTSVYLSLHALKAYFDKMA